MRTFVNESAENYLETILILSKKLPVVRSVDIANELGFTKPSVSVAMKNLRQKNQITVTDSGFIYLTDSGKEIAEMIYERHRILSELLISLGVPEDIATQDACRIEHVISAESFDAVKKGDQALPGKGGFRSCQSFSFSSHINPKLTASSAADTQMARSPQYLVSRLPAPAPSAKNRIMPK